MDSLQFTQQIKKLPGKPGIYIFRSAKKNLYIGKALNLKNRVRNYMKSADPRLQRMVHEAVKIDFIETDSDIEALILESQYIKKYRPDFNIMLRDDKQYGFVGFTVEEFSRLFITHQPNNNFKFKILNSKLKSQHADFIGPFTDMGALKTTLRLLRRIFPYCTCKQKHNNYCLNYHIGKCYGFCCLKKPEAEADGIKKYKKNIRAIKDILSGKKNSLIKNLEKDMHKLAKEQRFEEALELQNKLEKIKRIFKNAIIIDDARRQTAREELNKDALENLIKTAGLKDVPSRIEAYDIANIQGNFAVGAMIVFTRGQNGHTGWAPDKKEYRKFKIYSKSTPGDTAMLREVLLRRFKHPEWQFPGLIVIDGGKGQLSAATAAISKSEFLISKQNLNPKRRIPIIALTKNEKHLGEKILLGNGKEILLSKLPLNVKNLILHINAEAHRFAVSYYRKLHSKSLR